MSDSHLSNCFWLTNPISGNRNELSRNLAAQFRMECCQIVSEADYKVLESQLPGHVVVLDATGDDQESSAELQAARIAQALEHGNQPTIVCIGNRVPVHMVVDWMRDSIFAYVESNAPEDRVSKIVMAATEHADSILSRFQEFQVLNNRKLSLTLAEKAVLEMILDGIPNKTIATKLGVSQRTIEARRQKLYLKMGSKSLPGVVQSICQWRQLAAEFDGISIGDPTADFDRPSKSPKKDLIHPSQCIATPNLQAFVQAQYVDANCS